MSKTVLGLLAGLAALAVAGRKSRRGSQNTPSVLQVSVLPRSAAFSLPEVARSRGT
jgi:hypothetical protein